MLEQFIPESILVRIKRVGQMIDWYANTCDVPFIVGAAQLPQATAAALVTLLSFGMDDVVRGLIKPKGLYAHKPMGRVGRALSNALPELGESIGREVSKHSSYAQTAQAAGEGAVAKNLWRLDGAIQRVLFYYMITDVLIDFNRSIIKGVKTLGYCRASRTHRALKTNGTYVENNINPGWISLPTTPYVEGWENVGATTIWLDDFETKTKYVRTYATFDVTVHESMPPLDIRVGLAIYNYPKDRTRDDSKRMLIFPGVTQRITLAVAARGSIINWNVTCFNIPPTPSPPPTVEFFRYRLVSWSVQEVGRGTLPAAP